jgi:hypothetical protein
MHLQSKRSATNRLFFLSCGCVRELAKAFRGLLAAGIEGLIGRDDRHILKEISSVLARWDESTVFVEVRNKAAFHVNRELLRRGIQYARDASVMFIERDAAAHPLRYRRHTFAHELLVAGVFVPEGSPTDPPAAAEAAVEAIRPHLEAFLGAVSADMLRVIKLFDELFIAVMDGLKAGFSPSAASAESKQVRCPERLDPVKQALAESAEQFPRSTERPTYPIKTHSSARRSNGYAASSATEQRTHPQPNVVRRIVRYRPVVMAATRRTHGGVCCGYAPASFASPSARSRSATMR